ncbi:uncharacterized protein LOC107478120 isoform X1 [Arachis duranensis]|uniref:Uncharacterized protein LOC107478120 isoform X1 n=1 Tax=Arachis duranensis TaxID=130453 RepID=A0A6P4CNI1_ARADU|nr:uncharacterized protein LOC107478120 isoform X1 [Arachis duranensis]XP_015953754.1 uncharacterized protein LOC107478120 isoform X1 [Arachis duranensis]XP_015953755.1 uncharacterized protein LOC107478120 isoform X1 [Arachis duranensis]XP_052115053.1 uncharacterized protein LOC107478120 isoform X1 [Arachis duranensis]
MVGSDLDTNKVDGCVTTDVQHSYLRHMIDSIMSETSSSFAATFIQGSLQEGGERRNTDLEMSLAHEPMVSGTRESAVQNSCAASAMEWSIQLEKGLRSSKPGAPAQAILQLGRHLEQWSRELESDKSGIAPNVISGVVPGEARLFANAILLRLAGAFKGGDKEIKVSVVKAFSNERRHRNGQKHRECKGLLSKERVANHLELLNQVRYVFQNGDSESKELALILLGCWAEFAHDNAQIRYLILSSLVSSDPHVAKAACFAAGCFSEISDDFALITLHMVYNMMSLSTVSLPVKLAAAQVVPKLRSTFENIYKAYQAGVRFLSSILDEDVLVAVLSSLTELSSLYSPIAEIQVNFLISFLKRETTSRVQEAILRCLQFLFQKGLCQYPAEYLSSITQQYNHNFTFN